MGGRRGRGRPAAVGAPAPRGGCLQEEKRRGLCVVYGTGNIYILSCNTKIKFILFLFLQRIRIKKDLLK